MEFFAVADIALLSKHADKPYDPSSIAHQRIEKALASGPVVKTKFWGKLLKTDGFVTSVKSAAWRRAGIFIDDQGSRRMNRLFTPFTWATSFRTGQQDHRIFFTVGIDGPSKCLLWKLDCQNRGANALDERLVVRFEAFCAGRSMPVGRVSTDELSKWDWDKLLAASESFISDNQDLYDEAIEYVWQGRNPQKDKLARICWNTNDWQMPSGPIGKSQDPYAHERSDGPGFGGEEWLFNFSRLVGGYHYAYIRPLNTGAHAGEELNIKLYSRNGDTGQYYYVGRIFNAEVLTDATRDKGHRKHEEKGWFKEMLEELREGTGKRDANLFSSMFGEDTFNLRFRPENVERPEAAGGLQLISDFSKWTNNHRYVLLTDTSPEPGFVPRGKPRKKVVPEVVLRPTSKRGIQARTRIIQAASIELRALHEQVQSKLLKALRAEFPDQAVGKEALITVYNKLVDVARKTPSGWVFYEVKVLQSLQACIREALGQLVEYACWSEVQLAQEWIIVSHHALTDEAADYLARLRTTFGLPVSYLQVQLSSKQVIAGI